MNKLIIKTLPTKHNFIVTIGVFILFLIYLPWCNYIIELVINVHQGLTQTFYLLLLISPLGFFIHHTLKNRENIKQKKYNKGIKQFIFLYLIWGSIRFVINLFIVLYIHYYFKINLYDFTLIYFSIILSFVFFIECIALGLVGLLYKKGSYDLSKLTPNDIIGKLVEYFFVFVLIFVINFSTTKDYIEPHSYLYRFVTIILSVFLFFLYGEATIPFFIRKKRFFGVINLILIFISYTFLKAMILITINMIEFGESGSRNLDNSGQEALSLLYFGIMYGYVKRTNILNEEKQQEIIKQKDLENSLLQSQLDTLKNQINTHFIVNSLNFVRSKSLPLSIELSNSVLLFSKIMRYSLKEAIGEDNTNSTKIHTVPLENEIEHLNNYITFNQLRFSNELSIDFICEGSTRLKRIIPLLLINYVENAMKYGDLHDPENPLIIRLKIEANTIVFFVKNKKGSDTVVESHKVGNVNTKKRLELVYPNRHELTVIDEPDFYTVSLTIKL